MAEEKEKGWTAPQQEEQHKWLLRLVGDWTIEGECIMGPDAPPMQSMGQETVRAIGDFWMIAEGEMKSPEGSGLTRMTLGYDPSKKRFVGSWVGSMMANMWVYQGELDESKKVLTLNTVGPDFENEGKELNYQDIIEVVDDDTRILRSRMQAADGQWTQIMSATYKRKK